MINQLSKQPSRKIWYAACKSTCICFKYVYEYVVFSVYYVHVYVNVNIFIYVYVHVYNCIDTHDIIDWEMSCVCEKFEALITIKVGTTLTFHSPFEVKLHLIPWF